MKYITSREFVGLVPIQTARKELDAAPIAGSTVVHRHILFQKKISLSGRGAYSMRITADDYYKLYINQRPVAMGPAPSYARHRNFNEPDLTGCFRPGENLITVHVYYQGLLNRAYDSADNRCALGLALYENGKLICEADESWHYHYDAHYTAGDTTGYDTQFLENLDFTRYDESIYDGSRMGEPACPIDADYTLAKAPTPVIARETVKPREVRVLSDNEIFVDFGREYVGYPLFTMQGRRGQTLTLLCGEETEQDNGHRARAELRCNCRYRECLTMSGGLDRVDFFEYKAFRYLTLMGENVASAVDPAEIALLARHAAYENRGARLITATPLLQDIWDLCEHTAHYATQEGFLDCPTREKGQYLGDFTVSGLAHLYLSADPAMYRKTLFDFANSAEICPGLMAVAPGSLMQEIADFSLQYPLQVLNYYRYTGDRETALALLPIIRNMLRHFSRYERADGLLVGVIDKWNLVDWPENLRDGYDFDLAKPIAPDALHHVINAFYVGAHRCAEELAALLDRPFENRSDALAAAFNKVFFDAGQGLYTDSPFTAHTSLHANVLPVFFGFAPPESYSAVGAMIAEKRLCCGVQFSYFVLGACARMGAYDLEYALLTDRSERSWCNMLRQGATTLFEAWGKEQKSNTSLCHPWASAPIIALCHDFRQMRAMGFDVQISGFQRAVP